MSKLFAYFSLDPAMTTAVVAAFVVVVIFLAIAIAAHKMRFVNNPTKKQKIKEKDGLQPRSLQQITDYTATDVQPDNYAQRHWGNLSIEERYSKLLPEGKVLYIAAKKQLDAGRLTNFSSQICEIYFDGDVPAARLLIYRGLVYLFLNIAPDTLDKDIYAHEDASDKDGYEMLPTMIIIKDGAQIDRIPELLDMIARN